MKFTKIAAAASVLVASLALAGCSSDTTDINTTLVHGKLCAIADSAGWDDQGLNRETFIALEKAKVSVGIALSVDELAATDTHAIAQKKLTALANGSCSLVIASGDWLSSDVYTVALKHQNVEFLLTDHHFELSSDIAHSHPLIPANVHFVANQMSQAAFEAGYLAAMSSQTHTVASLIAIGSPSTILQSKLSAAFAAGVSYFSTHNPGTTKIISEYPVPKIAPASEAIRQTVSGLVERGVDRLFVLSAKDFATVAAQTESFAGLQLIGAERDWAINKSTAKYASRILASVIRKKNISSIYDFITYWVGGHTASPSPSSIDVNDINSDGVGITDAHAIAYPLNFVAQFKPLIQILVSDGGMTE